MLFDELRGSRCTVTQLKMSDFILDGYLSDSNVWGSKCILKKVIELVGLMVKHAWTHFGWLKWRGHSIKCRKTLVSIFTFLRHIFQW